MELIHPYLFAGMIHEKPTIDRVESVVCKYFDVEPQLLHVKCRKRVIVQAKQYICYFMYDTYSVTYPAIAAYFKMDHTSIMHNAQVIRNEAEHSDTVRHNINNIKQLLKFI
jgi:chromosomal replication initiator protein